VDESKSVLNSQQRKKAARKLRKQSERQAHRNLDARTEEAIDAALALAPTVADGPRLLTGHALDLEIASISEAEFIRKRVNDALNVGEWLADVRVWIWKHDEHVDEALTGPGAVSGFELRLGHAISE